MRNIKECINAFDWAVITGALHDKGFVIVKNVLTEKECDELIDGYDVDGRDEGGNRYEGGGRYRKTVNMERYRFGSGEYKYFQYPLPDLITQLREGVYPKIVPVANQWMEELGLDKRFPLTHREMKKISHDNGQTKPTVLILKYAEGGFNTLHQDLYGEVYFPMQMVFMLDQAGKDYTGGELVITEQIPRAQSKVNVLKPDLGDMVIFTTNFRPCKSVKGFYRVSMKHGISPLGSGRRHSLGVIFHDALS